MREKTIKIRRLDPEVVKQIAAGEVIENPSSVVKELIENSIDAGATEIDVEIEGGGLECIRVTDNGEGMERDEIPLAVERYTTSKIRDTEDLRRIRTLGFRGEALYAIATVSKLTIKSRTEKELEGWEGYFEGGKLVEMKPCSHPVGSTVECKNLFFNLPVRRKFTGSPKQEARRVIEVVSTYVLAHPGCGFTLSIDGETVINVPPAQSRRKRIEDLYGPDFVSDMLPLDYSNGRMAIEGFVSRPDKLKGSVVTQHIFVNGRRVKDDKIRSAIYRGYGETKGHPQFLIFLDVLPSELDFNIHPQKSLVKFSPSLKIFEKVLKAVKRSLDSEREPYGEKGGKERTFLRILEPSPRFESVKGGRQLEFGELEREREEEGEPLREVYLPQSLIQIHNSYIFVQVKSGFLIVDQHAAHERIIYEKLKNRKAKTQILLFPYVVNLTPLQFKTFGSFEPLFLSFGFKIRRLSGRSIVIEGIPDVFKGLEKDDFIEILEELTETKSLPDKFHNLLKTIACKAAVKSGDPLTVEEMNRLLDELFACENPFFCPHGRPAVIKTTLEELERKFGRR
jgi:DNA mismatch repair protein MutL